MKFNRQAIFGMKDPKKVIFSEQRSSMLDLKEKEQRKNSSRLKSVRQEYFIRETCQCTRK